MGACVYDKGRSDHQSDESIRPPEGCSLEVDRRLGAAGRASRAFNRGEIVFLPAGARRQKLIGNIYENPELI